MSVYNFLAPILGNSQYKWCVTGAAGFIGSHLIEALLTNGQKVIGLDSLVTGKESNIDAVRKLVGESASQNLSFLKGDIRDTAGLKEAFSGCDFVLHQAALGSVPRSMKEPVLYHDNNVTGTVSVFDAARSAGVKKVVYASSSSVYGDNADLPKIEEKTGKALSPYALSKQMNELDADLFIRAYGMNLVGLRYFNVFGPRQDPNGAYAAVIPRWIGRLIKGEECEIFGDGSTSRDFSPVPNVVEANILAALSNAKIPTVFNVGLGNSTSLTNLYNLIFSEVCKISDAGRTAENLLPKYLNEREGDIRHSCANIGKISAVGYREVMSLSDGITWTVKSFS